MNEDMQDAIDQAAEAPGRTFNGQPLQPFSFARQACWQRCGFEAAESEFESTVAITFLCTLGDEMVDKQTGKQIIDGARGSGIPAFRARFEAWADALNLTANNELGIEAARIGFSIWKETHESRFKPVATGAAPPNA